MGKSEMFEQLASKEEESNPIHIQTGMAAATGALAGGIAASHPVVRDAVNEANIFNSIAERDYLAKKDRNICYRYSQVQSSVIRDRMNGLNEELGLLVNKYKWTQRQREQFSEDAGYGLC